MALRLPVSLCNLGYSGIWLSYAKARLQVLESAGKHQVLIFVHSRKETAKTARFLKEEALREDKLSLFMKACHGWLTHVACNVLECLCAKCQVHQTRLMR